MSDRDRYAELLEKVVKVFGEAWRDRFAQAPLDELERTWALIEGGHRRARTAGGRLYADWDDAGPIRVIQHPAEGPPGTK